MYNIYTKRFGKKQLSFFSCALFRHSLLTDHVINYSNPKILARDNNSFRLQIKKTLKIKEYCAHKSLNGNLG